MDATCIDCDTCRQLAPGVFQDHGGQSSVYRQLRIAENVFFCGYTSAASYGGWRYLVVVRSNEEGGNVRRTTPRAEIEYVLAQL